MVDEITAAVSRFVVDTKLADIPTDAVGAALRSILDGLGLAVAGRASLVGQLAAAEVDSYGCSVTDSSVLGSSVRLPSRFAAFLNGLAIHADDFDDTQLATLPDRVYGLLTHPTAPVLPAALALGERLGRSGADLLLAYLVGVETEAKISEAIDPRHYEAGFHSTATAGAIGAAAAAARILALDVEQTEVALGIAASCASGLRENFGTMTKPFHAGRAAESGVLAAQLAANGFTAAHNILEARRGFFSAAGGGFDRPTMERLGAPWTFSDPGVSIKPYPSGSLTHPAMTVMAQLLRDNDVQAGDVELVYVGTNRHMPNALIHHHPADHLAAKFSMEFCMAVLVVAGRAGLAEFTDEAVRRPDIQSMMERVRFEVDPEADGTGYNNMTSIVRVHLNNGTVLRGRADFAKGSPANPMTHDELFRKFADCLAVGGISSSAAERAAELVGNLEDQPALGEITGLLCPAES